MKKIYFNHSQLIISSAIELNNPTFISDDINDEILGQHLLKLESGVEKYITLIGLNENVVFERISSFYTPITASGGIIEHTNGTYLFMFRRDKWDLPKGKMDEGESTLATAIREIEEETGVTGLELIAELNDTYHVYEAFGKKFLKTTHWFHFKTAFSAPLIPQIEEEITDIKWMNQNELLIIKENTYKTILDILTQLNL